MESLARGFLVVTSCDLALLAEYPEGSVAAEAACGVADPGKGRCASDTSDILSTVEALCCYEK